MGAGESSEGVREYHNARASFSPEEIKHLDEFFTSAAEDNEHHHSPSKHSHRKFIWEQFEKATSAVISKDVKSKLYGELCRITQRILNKSDCKYVNYDAFYIGLSHLLKGSSNERAYIFKLMCAENNFAEEIHLANVTKYLLDLSTTFIEIEKRTKNFSTWQCQPSDHSPQLLVDYYVSEWHRYFEKYKIEAVNDEWLEKWLSNSPMVYTMMSTVFYAAFDKNFSQDRSEQFCASTLPMCTVTDWRYFQSFLDVPSLFFLNHQIPSDRRNVWRLLFSTSSHGESFATMLKHICNEGPLLIIVKEKNGHIFGAFSSVNLDLSPNFVGDDRTFVFTLFPSMRCYHATGFDKNYCYLNMHQETMPNGLGFGGKLSIGDQPIHFFSLWLDSEFGKGKSQAACSTFKSPQLSSAEHFQIYQMEIWGIGDKPDSKKEKKTTSVLDIDPEAKAILAMTGKGPVSEGLRESDETAGNPSTHEIPIK